jgi:hypothetical protein
LKNTWEKVEKLIIAEEEKEFKARAHRRRLKNTWEKVKRLIMAKEEKDI